MFGSSEYHECRPLRSVAPTQMPSVVKAGSLHRAVELFLGRGDGEHALRARVRDGVLHRRVEAGDREGLAARDRPQREVHDVGAVVGGPADAVTDVLGGARAGLEHLHGQDGGRRRHADDSDAVVADRGDRSGHGCRVLVVLPVRATEVAAAARPLTLRTAGEGGALQDLALKVRLAEVDAGVDDGHHCPGARAARPGLLGLDLLQTPQLGVQRVVGGRLGRGGSGQGAHQGEGSGGAGECAVSHVPGPFGSMVISRRTCRPRPAQRHNSSRDTAPVSGMRKFLPTCEHGEAVAASAGPAPHRTPHGTAPSRHGGLGTRATPSHGSS